MQSAAAVLATALHAAGGVDEPARTAVLHHAISLLAVRAPRAGIAELAALIEQQDDALVARAAKARCYSEERFGQLARELAAIQRSDSGLFDPFAEALTAETLIGRHGDSKVPLAIVSTRFLGEVPRIQAWVAELVGCLSRHIATRPGKDLHTMLVIDEAELFLPAGATKVPSKEPLQELLKCARTAGLGVVLSSQRPAELEHRNPDLISTWFLGRIGDPREVDLLNGLLDRSSAPMRGKLTRLERGRFVMLRDRKTTDLERALPLLKTEELPEAELLTLAAQTGPRRQVGAASLQMVR